MDELAGRDLSRYTWLAPRVSVRFAVTLSILRNELCHQVVSGPYMTGGPAKFVRPRQRNRAPIASSFDASTAVVRWTDIFSDDSLHMCFVPGLLSERGKRATLAAQNPAPANREQGEGLGLWGVNRFRNWPLRLLLRPLAS